MPGMSKKFRPWNVQQDFLLPPSLLDWLPEHHLARFVLEVVEELDLAPIYEPYERELRGYPPYEPKMMVALLLYAYCTGVTSARKIERKTQEDVAFRVLAGNQSPDHSRISEFRRRHGVHFESLFVQMLKLCARAGLVKLGHVALDGTKLKANASKHKAMSYERMQNEEEKLREKVKELLAQAEAVDVQEDALHGQGKRGDELPEELRRAQTRLQRIREARQALEAEARGAAEADKSADDDDDAPPTVEDLPSHTVSHTAEGRPTPKAQRNFTDSDSRIMKKGTSFEQAYNAQAAVDSAHQVIVAQALTNQPPDAEHLPALVDRVAAHLEAVPRKLSADAGYFSAKNVHWLESVGVEPYIATGRQKHGQAPPKVRGRPPAGLTPKERMARKLATTRGKEVYRMRKAIVEPVFGQIKEARAIRALLRRGLRAAREEWALICATHNLLKLFRATAV
ncbi:IS1182 family transposase [Corallococcus interemptor]|uniref:IS1182 family transposase n=2 Tax=Corallococcus interemptor TaxID=2316720 RepID=A0A3A8PK61_9BACT|nr:IS1182 family transposase [Corallococcus interemptor]RKH56746.1 IS1182 family transposase [Corallococcus interemptor]